MVSARANKNLGEHLAFDTMLRRHLPERSRSI